MAGCKKPVSSEVVEQDSNTAFTVVDLFCGAGGVSLGFQRAGFRVVTAYDAWLPAVETYQSNFTHDCQQIEITRALELPPVDVIVGGPPCQGFSSAGTRRTDDARNTLVSVFASLVARHKPRAFVFENVEGFLTGSHGSFVLELLEPVIQAGYFVHVRKVNAANFGVPQHRKRVIAIGGLGWEPSFPRSTHSALGAPGAHLANGRASAPAVTLLHALGDLPEPSRDPEAAPLSDHYYVPLKADDLARAKLLRPGERMKDLPEELWHKSYRRRAFRRVMDGTPTERRGGAPAGIRRLKCDEPSKAITSGALREFIHPSSDRPLSIRECAILQSFPVNFEFRGRVADRIQLIGNAVPPLLAQCIAHVLQQDLLLSQKSKARGALLSFVPTLSEGMSPALAAVTKKVTKRFRVSTGGRYQASLWD
ncbi:MAG: DNA cytosine methyltransferase [Pirellulales bacterium]|nr:DNA cytosine methyltransferase [Pirellulales bacterium]